MLDNPALNELYADWEFRVECRECFDLINAPRWSVSTAGRSEQRAEKARQQVEKPPSD